MKSSKLRWSGAGAPYVMLLGYALMFLGTHPGRVLGLDGLLSRRLSAPALARRPWAKALALLT